MRRRHANGCDAWRHFKRNVDAQIADDKRCVAASEAWLAVVPRGLARPTLDLAQRRPSTLIASPDRR